MTDLIQAAKEFALKAHGDQKYGDKPYEYHLQKVVDNVIDNINELDGLYWFNPITIAIATAWLHDTLEDTKVTATDFERAGISDVVQFVINVTDAPGANRKERKLNTWHKIRRSEISIYVKLCDRLANVSEGGKLDMYREEMPLFEAALYFPGQFEGLWEKIRKALA